MREQVLAVVTSPRLGRPLTTESFRRHLRRVDRPPTAGPNRPVDEAGGVGERVAHGALPARVGGVEEREHAAQGGVDVGDGERAGRGGPDGGRDEAGVWVGRLGVAAVAATGRNATVTTTGVVMGSRGPIRVENK